MSRQVSPLWIRVVALLAAFALPVPAGALDLAFPGPADTTATRREALTSVRLPVGPFAGGTMPTQLAEGALDQRAFRIALDKPSTLDLMRGLRGQLAGLGYEILFECETDLCGGFDFRYGADVLPEPDMHVDLGDFRYLAARLDTPRGPEHLSLLVSRSLHDGHVQLTRVGPGVGAEPALTASTKSTLPAPPAAQPGAGVAFSLSDPAPAPRQSIPSLADLGKRLELGQAQVLEDLVFPSGSSSLAEGDYVSLAALADWLRADATRKVALVGHTDADGSLAANLNLSKLRAESVRQTLLYTHGVAPDQVVAEGVGYLAPRDTNQTEEGRARNRRVEVLPTSTQLVAP